MLKAALEQREVFREAVNGDQENMLVHVDRPKVFLRVISDWRGEILNSFGILAQKID